LSPKLYIQLESTTTEELNKSREKFIQDMVEHITTGKNLYLCMYCLSAYNIKTTEDILIGISLVVRVFLWLRP
jgi:GTP-dependent phosphoenolpyruvate carboxykinase